jgi:ABC-type phosphate/phosphonate transport system substrate-binding protein
MAASLAVIVQGAQALTFAVNEGVTYRVPDEEIRVKYAVIATDLSKLLKQPVNIVPVSQYPVLRKGLADKTYDLAMVHPAHISIEAMNKSGYRLVAVTKGFQEYRASFLVRADSPLKSLTDLKDRSLGAPDEDSITAWMTRASIRDALGNAAQVKYVYTRYQDAVPFFVENNLTQSGSTASSAVIKQWQAKGGKVLFTSRPVPIKHIIAGPHLSAEELAKVRDYLLELDSTEDGRKKLAGIQWKGFAPYDQAELIKIGAWLGI